MNLYRSILLEERDLIHEDDRGVITSMIPPTEIIKSVLYITGKKGSERGNHIHKKDTHYCYVVSGSIKYVWEVWDEDTKRFIKHEASICAGDIVYTPTDEPHKFVFQTDGAFIAMATEGRGQKAYEQDIIKKNI